MENKLRITTVIIVAILLTGGLFTAVNTKASAAVNLVADASSIPVVINEFMADNDAAVPSPYGNYPDWIELYNKGDTTVDLSGMYLTSNITNPTWQFAAGTKIGPKSYLVIWADDKPRRGPLHTDFTVKANGGTLGLFASDGETLIDSVVYSKQLRDISYGRTHDGDSSWSYMTTPTAGEANIANARVTTAMPWPIWVFIILALVACVAFVLKDKIRTGRKK